MRPARMTCAYSEVTRLMETFGDALRRLRTEAGLTQGDLAKQANWSQSQISRAEQNQFVPDEATVARLDRALGASDQLVAARGSAKSPYADSPGAAIDLLHGLYRA